MTKAKKQRGFTLIELMIVVAIIGIIAAIAYPSYMETVRRSNRTDAKTELNDLAQRLQRCYTTYSAYNNANCGVHNQLTGGNKVTSGEGMYEIELSSVNATTYTLRATPISGTTQANDAKCTAFTLTHQGARDAQGSLGADCW